MVRSQAILKWQMGELSKFQESGLFNISSPTSLRNDATYRQTILRSIRLMYSLRRKRKLRDWSKEDQSELYRLKTDLAEYCHPPRDSEYGTILTSVEMRGPTNRLLVLHHEGVIKLYNILIPESVFRADVDHDCGDPWAWRYFLNIKPRHAWAFSTGVAALRNTYLNRTEVGALGESVFSYPIGVTKGWRLPPYYLCFGVELAKQGLLYNLRFKRCQWKLETKKIRLTTKRRIFWRHQHCPEMFEALQTAIEMQREYCLERYREEIPTWRKNHSNDS